MHFPLLGTLLLGAVTTVVGNFFVTRRNQIEAQREFRIAELKVANDIFDEISVSLAALAQASRDAAWSLVLRPDRDTQWLPEDVANWADYNREQVSWNRSWPRNLALAKKYFGREVTDELQRIHKDLTRLEWRVSQTYYGDSSRGLTENNIQRNYLRISDRLLEVDIVNLTESMIEKIQNQEVGALKAPKI